MVLSRAEIFRVGLSWTEYTDDLGLSQKMSFFRCKSEVIRARSERLLLIFSVICVPLCSAALYRGVQKFFYFGKCTLFWCLRSPCPSPSDPICTDCTQSLHTRLKHATPWPLGGARATHRRDVAALALSNDSNLPLHANTLQWFHEKNGPDS